MGTALVPSVQISNESSLPRYAPLICERDLQLFAVDYVVVCVSVARVRTLGLPSQGRSTSAGLEQSVPMVLGTMDRCAEPVCTFATCTTSCGKYDPVMSRIDAVSRAMTQVSPAVAALTGRPWLGKALRCSGAHPRTGDIFSHIPVFAQNPSSAALLQSSSNLAGMQTFQPLQL